jgi:glucosylceramidase
VSGGAETALPREEQIVMTGRVRACFPLLLLVSFTLAGCVETDIRGIPVSEEPRRSMSGFSAAGRTVTVFTTAKDSDDRLSETGRFEFVPGEQPPETDVAVFVTPTKLHQTLLGIGGALTDASAEVFSTLSADKQEEFLRAYFDPLDGIGYSLSRTPIHSCDFSSASFTYVEEGDAELESFTVEHDREFRIPFIKRAIEAAGGELTMFVSPWSPPAFMKSNGTMLQGGKLLPEYAGAWARYYAKFIKAYEEEGIPIWGLTIQNEPMATQTWESCIYTAEEERDFLRDHLGPTLAREGLGEKKIVVWDHNRDLIAHRVDTILGDSEAASFVWGIGYHWYEAWTGGESMHENLRQVRDNYPELKLLFTEGTPATFVSGDYENWSNAERYGREMIRDFNIGTVGWVDWNVLLDENGGPNHVGNFCVAPVHADTRTGELFFTPSYYYLGHFSKFVRPGARRVSTSSSRSALLATTFLNPDDTVATIVMNPGESEISFRFFVGTSEAALVIPPRAIQTLVY